jgi:DNA-binding transcriptional MerR regulator
MRKGMSIGEVSRDTGVRIRTIRFYEAGGVVTAPARTGAGYGIYAVNDVPAQLDVIERMFRAP